MPHLKKKKISHVLKLNSNIFFRCGPNPPPLQYLYAWISARAPKLSDSSAWTISALQRRWRGDSDTLGKQDDARWVSNMAPSLMTTPACVNKRRWLKHFALLVLMCLWSNDWSGPWVLAHYPSTEPALRCGRLSALIRLVCHFKAYSPITVKLQFENLHILVMKKSTFWRYVLFP